MGDSFAIDRRLCILGVGVEGIVIASETTEEHNVGLGDGSSRTLNYVADSHCLEVPTSRLLYL